MSFEENVKSGNCSELHSRIQQNKGRELSVLHTTLCLLFLFVVLSNIYTYLRISPIVDEDFIVAPQKNFNSLNRSNE